MMRKTFALALGVMLVAGVATQADAAKRAKKPKIATITLMGCARWAPPACTNLSFRGQTYSLFGASPTIPYNVGVTVVGVKAGDVSLCFGTPIKVLRWTRNRMLCPLM